MSATSATENTDSSDLGTDTVEADNVNVGLIATITVVGALLVIALALALTALVREQTAAVGDEVGSYADLGTVKRMKVEQRAKLEAPPTWADQTKGIVTVPIDHAMQLVTSEIQRDPTLATEVPSAAPALATPPPAPAPATSAATGGVDPAPSTDAAAADKDPKHKNNGKHGAKGAPVTPASAPAPHG